MAVNEDKTESAGRSGLVARNSAPLWQGMAPLPSAAEQVSERAARDEGKTREIMRKHMTRVIEESLADDKRVVYIGEDVEHGGYYLVTENIKGKYPTRIADFVPDETALVGAGMGYAQAGLVPIVEIPYAKYLDCAYDMYEEAAFMNWYSAGRQPNGMLFRLQGFGRGVFGGNFHTHNALHIPPGIDAVCYSNGRDYVRGFRNAMHQAKQGRVVMSVDSTHLLNLRNMDGSDGLWDAVYPEDKADVMPFDEVRVYSHEDKVRAGGCFGVRGAKDAEAIHFKPAKKREAASGAAGGLAIVTYGEGVLLALQARKNLVASGALAPGSCHVIDSPYLSLPSAGLVAALSRYSRVVFAEVCKEGQGPLEGFIPRLQSSGALPQHWRSVAAARTYNPLGSTVTFTSVEDISKAVTSFTAD